ncbi:hypothetical protein ACS0TY_002075 [Phlomoides rotata]
MEDVDDGTSLSTENEQNNEASHMENEIYDLTTMVEDLDAMVEAEINEECTENNNEGNNFFKKEKNIENDDVRGSLLGIIRETRFSVRKSSTRYSSSKGHIELSKLFVCSCSGEKMTRSDCSSTKKSFVTRTNCKAMMRTKRNQEGLFEVVRHEIEHNHPLIRTEWSYLHRSERKITDEKAIAIEDLTSSEMRATKSLCYLAHNAGGEKNVAGKSIPWRHNITRKFYNLVLRSEDNEDAIKNIEESLKRDSLTIDSLCCTKSVRTLSSGKSSSKILDPTRSRTK